MAYRDVVLADAPISYWRLGETSGTNAVDEQGANAGTYAAGMVQGARSLIAGDRNPAAQFSGVDLVAVNCGNAAGLQLTTGTLEAWMTTTTTPSNTPGILTKASAFALFVNTTGHVDSYDWTANFYLNSGTASAAGTAGPSLTDGLPHHVVLTFISGSAGNALVYVDGALVAMGRTQLTVLAQTTAVQIGGGNSANQYLNGTVDEAAVYGTVLSATTIRNHYLAGAIAAAGRAYMPRSQGPQAVGPTFFAALQPKPAASTANSYTQSVAGVLSFVGARALQTGKALTAGLSFVGAILRAIVHVLSAVLSFVGKVTKAVTRPLVGAVLSFSGAMARQTGKALTAVLSFTGSIVRAIVHTMAAVLSFAGALSRALSRALSATLSFAGNTAKRTSRAFTAVLSFVGTLVSGAIHYLNLTGVLSFAGALSRATTKALTAALSFTGSILRAITHTMTAALTFAGSTARSTQRALAAGLSFVGTLASGAIHFLNLTGALSFVGSVASSLVHGGGAVAAKVLYLANQLFRKMP